MSTRGNAPRLGTWVVCLVLYVVAVASHFGVIHPDPRIAIWSWIVGFGLLLIACRFRGL